MHTSYLISLTSMVAIAVAGPLAVEKRAVTCTNGAVVFLVRGSDPQQTTLGNNPRYSNLPAAIVRTAKAVTDKAGGNSYSQAIQYPAINPDTGMYGQSVNMGIVALQKAIGDYVAACKNGEIFAIGYSQGAQVVGGSLGGGPAAGPLKNAGRFTGGVLLADPTYVDKIFPVDSGSGSDNNRNGVIANVTKYQFLDNKFPQRVRSYCQAGDAFCDSGSGPDNRTIHLAAPSTFEQNATTFLVGRV